MQDLLCTGGTPKRRMEAQYMEVTSPYGMEHQHVAAGCASELFRTQIELGSESNVAGLQGPSVSWGGLGWFAGLRCSTPPSSLDPPGLSLRVIPAPCAEVAPQWRLHPFGASVPETAIAMVIWVMS